MEGRVKYGMIKNWRSFDSTIKVTFEGMIDPTGSTGQLGHHTHTGTNSIHTK